MTTTIETTHVANLPSAQYLDGPRRLCRVLRTSSALLCAASLCIWPSLVSIATGDVVDDNDLLEAIEAELGSDESLTADTIDADVEAGVVRLSGETFTLLSKQRAVRLVGTLKGVRAVVDLLEVRPSGRSDELIFVEVQAALRDDPVADEAEIHVTVGQGRVALEGTVDSFSERLIAAAAVAGVRGVVKLDNNIAVNTKTNRPDAEIKPEVLRRFELNPFLAEGLIDVEVRGGVVSLTGSVGSVNERDLAGVLAWVAGVSKVDTSSLEIKWQDRVGRRGAFTVPRSETELRRAVEDALFYDPYVRGAKIVVRVRLATVVLTGNVSSLAAKRSAQRDATNTLGVRRVINNLKVKIADWPGDLAVTKRAQQALARDAHLADLDLRASSHFGKVYVSGDVNTRFDKRRAELIVANVPGAMDVVNRINVETHWQPKPDDEIEEDVRRRLRWSALLDAEQISVSVDQGTVTLRGEVDTWQERKSAGRHAFQGGARLVDNELEVRTRPSTPAGLKATLIPKQTEYDLDSRLSGDEFRRFLERVDPVHEPERLPPAPDVDLVLRLDNQGDEPIDVRLGHDKGEIELSLTGSGAVHVALGRSFVAEFRPGRVVTIEPGSGFEIPIQSLQYGFRNASDRWYWTESGEYTLQATLTWPADDAGFVLNTIAATPVKLAVAINNPDESP